MERYRLKLNFSETIMFDTKRIYVIKQIYFEAKFDSFRINYIPTWKFIDSRNLHLFQYEI